MNDEYTLAYRNLQPADIFDVLDELGFLASGRFLALNSYENRVYRIGLEDGGDIVVKFYRPGRWSDDAIVEEHDFALELADQDLPVVAPLEIEDETLFHTGPFRLAIYPCHGGRAPDLDNEEQLKQLGRFVARIHLIGATADFEFRPKIDIASYGYESRDYLLDSGFVPAEMRDVYLSVADLVLSGVEECFARVGRIPEIRLHADFHPGNVLIAGDSFHIVDLDDARTGPAVQDLWMFLSGDRAEMEPQLAALLAGYTAFRAFPANELCLIEALRSLRIIHYAAWLARRWDDPAFQMAFPWFAARRYWDEHVLALREQIALLQESPLVWRDDR